jgi:hypothetical protein
MQRVAEKTRLGVTLPELFEKILTIAANDADPAAPTVRLAEKIYKDQRYDMEPLFRSWIVPRIARMLATKRPVRDLRQLRLPGFELLPVRIIGKRDHRVQLANATFADLRAYRWKLFNSRFRSNPKVAQIEKLMEVVKPFPRGTKVQDALAAAAPAK